MKRLLCLALVGLVAGCTPPPRPEPVWVGHLAPQTGPSREAGEESIRAMQFALEQARADNFLVNGRFVGVRHVDSAPDKGRARAEAIRLLAVNGVSALIVGPEVGNADEVVAAAQAQLAPVIVLDEMADPPNVASVVLLGSDPVARGEKLAEAALERLKGVKVAVVIDGSRPVCVRLAEAFVRVWREKGREARSWSGADQSEAIRTWAPDAVLLAVPAATLRDPKRPLTSLVKGQTILYGGEDVEDLVRGDLLRGEEPASLLGVTAFEGKQGLTDEGKKLFEGLEKKREPVGRASALALDGIRLLLELMKSAKSASREKLREALAEMTSFETVCGEMKWREYRPRRPLFVVQRPAGKP